MPKLRDMKRIVLCRGQTKLFTRVVYFCALWIVLSLLYVYHPKKPENSVFRKRGKPFLQNKQTPIPDSIENNSQHEKKELQNQSPIKVEGNLELASQASCVPTRNVFFMKIHKTGSSTLYTVLNRVALSYHLRVSTYNKRPYFSGRGQQSIVKNILPPYETGKSEKYNMILDHAYFEQEDIESILEGPIRYVTIMRDPLERLRSWFYYMGRKHLKKKHRNLRGTDNQLLLKVSYSFKKRDFSVPYFFGISQNIISDDLALQSSLKKLDKIFFVGITEYFTHSVVLLKRNMCWQLRDMLYVSLRTAAYHHKQKISEKKDKNLRKKVCEIHKGECLMYDHFNKTFWNMVEQEGQDLHDEVDHFENILDKVADYCPPPKSYKGIIMKDYYTNQQPLHIPASRWNADFNISRYECLLMRLKETAIANFHYYTQNRDACNNLMMSETHKCVILPKTGKKAYNKCYDLCKRSPVRTHMLQDLLLMNSTILAKKTKEAEAEEMLSEFEELMNFSSRSS